MRVGEKKVKNEEKCIFLEILSEKFGRTEKMYYLCTRI